MPYQKKKIRKITFSRSNSVTHWVTSVFFLLKVLIVPCFHHRTALRGNYKYNLWGNEKSKEKKTSMIYSCFLGTSAVCIVSLHYGDGLDVGRSEEGSPGMTQKKKKHIRFGDFCVNENEAKQRRFNPVISRIMAKNIQTSKIAGKGLAESITRLLVLRKKGGN